MMKVPTETQEQSWLMKWSMQPSIRKQYPALKLLFHIPNERSDAVQAAILQRMGVKRGVPDLFLPVPVGIFHGLWIEMKRTRDGRLSDDQKWWKEELIKQGYAWCVCCGWKEGSAALEGYLNGNLTL